MEKLCYNDNRGVDFMKIVKGNGVVEVQDVSNEDLLLQKRFPKLFWKGVTKVGKRAFYEDDELFELNIPEGVEEIGAEAFAYCINLRKITLPKSLKKIDIRAFYGCEKLKAITFPEGVKVIGDGVCEECMQLKSVQMSDNVVEIGKGAFSECKNLESIYMSKNIEKIGDFAFCDCESLASIDLEDKKKLEYIGKYCFACSGLEKVVLPDGIEVVKEGTFDKCRGLKSAKTGKSVLVIERKGFCGCETLREIEVNEGLENIGNFAFRNCRKLKEFIVPKSLDNIGQGAFSECKSLLYMFLRNVEKVGVGAFANSALDSIDMPAVKFLRPDVFKGCISLNLVNVNPEVRISPLVDGGEKLDITYRMLEKEGWERYFPLEDWSEME